jgi:hypothetical protein
MDAGAEEQLTNGINATSCSSSRFDAKWIWMKEEELVE